MFKKEFLDGEYSDIKWISETGLSENELSALFYKTVNDKSHSDFYNKAKATKIIAEKSRIAIDKNDIFQDKLFGGGLLSKLRVDGMNNALNKYLKDLTDEERKAENVYGAWSGHCDFGHISPNTALLLNEGFSGIADRARNHLKTCPPEKHDFYEGCVMAQESMMILSRRLCEAIKPYNEKNSDALYNVSKGRPQTVYEAMQCLIVYFFMHEYVTGARVRTLGRLDVLLYPFYQNDIKNGTYTKEEIKDLLRFFLYKFWVAKVPFDLPFALGGLDNDGNDVTNELSYLIVEVYDSLNIYSPKIHIKVNEKTPKEFITLVLSCIRKGNSSFVFINDNTAIKSLESVGISRHDAVNYVPIGCYEPAVWGVEVGCTGNGYVNLAKAVELALNDGRDFKTGKKIGLDTGVISDFDSFTDALKKQIAFLTKKETDYIRSVEKYYPEMYTDPIMSSMYDACVESGLDAYESGAKYNNSSVAYIGLATLVDSVCAVKKIVFDGKLVSFEDFAEILKNDWNGGEDLRRIAVSGCEKYGNNSPFADNISVEYSNYITDILSELENGRGGVFKGAMFSIDQCFDFGYKTGATPDGRHAFTPVSKNLCSTDGMDKNGVTSLILSVTKNDMSRFPDGSVLDFVIHPSAVEGEEGLEAFYSLIDVYFKRGGFAIHGNVFDVNSLREAQKNPEKYKNLQVRLCGWNAYFVNLTRDEQESFILQCEARG